MIQYFINVPSHTLPTLSLRRQWPQVEHQSTQTTSIKREPSQRPSLLFYHHINPPEDITDDIITWIFVLGKTKNCNISIQVQVSKEGRANLAMLKLSTDLTSHNTCEQKLVVADNDAENVMALCKAILWLANLLVWETKLMLSQGSLSWT